MEQESVVVDLGNSLLKGMKDGRPDSAVVVPHALKTVTGRKFDEIQTRMSGGLLRGVGGDVDLFEYGGSHYLMGEKAEYFGIDTRQTGGAKYTPGYYGALFMSILLRLYPNGHDNLRVMAAFPPGDVRHTPQLRQALGGKHVVTLSNKQQITYKVRQVLCFDEPVGGLWNWMLASGGQHYTKHVVEGHGLCIDIGGKVSSLVPFWSDGRVSYERAISIDLGIQDVMAHVSELLLSNPEYAPHFRHVRGGLPFDEDMRDALIDGYYRCGGLELPCLDAVTDATAELRQQIKRVYEQDMGGARPYKFIIATGGGSRVMFAQIVEHVLNFPPNKVFLSHEDRNKIHLANLFGGDKALAAMEAKTREQALSVETGAKKNGKKGR